MNQDPITAALALLPPTARMIVVALISLIAIASMITGLLPPSAQGNIVVKTIRLISGVVHASEPGTFKIPFTNIVLGVTATTETPAAPPAAPPPTKPA